MKVNVIGAGLAGSEAAYQLAKRGIRVRLYESDPINLQKPIGRGWNRVLEFFSRRRLKMRWVVKEEMRMLDSRL